LGVGGAKPPENPHACIFDVLGRASSVGFTEYLGNIDVIHLGDLVVGFEVTDSGKRKRKRKRKRFF
jgi:hypothetical protein